MVEESSHPLRFFWRANCNTDQHYWGSFSTKQQECYIFASDIQKKHMDINRKMWQKIFNEGWGTEKMGKKHTYVTDIYQMHGSFQALGIKRPQSLNLSNRHTHVRNQRKRKAKSSLKKKKEESCLICFYRADIYSRTWLFQRLPPWPEFGSCTARALLSACSNTARV